MPGPADRRNERYEAQREEMQRRKAAARPNDPLSADDRVFYRETGRAPYVNSNARGTTREDILQSYATQDAQRAQNARLRAQGVSQSYTEHANRTHERATQRAAMLARQHEEKMALAQREQDEVVIRQRAAQQAAAEQLAARRRAITPLSSEESHERTRIWQENYEFERESRDVFSRSMRMRGGNREIIDGRGSIDSRALNEYDILIGYSIDERDRPSAHIETTTSSLRWHSRAGQGFDGRPDAGARGLGIVRAMGWNSKQRPMGVIPNNELSNKHSNGFWSPFTKILVAGVLVILAAAAAALFL